LQPPWTLEVLKDKEKKMEEEKKEKQLLDWKCQNCGYMLKAETPPEVCPSCKQKCEFVNVTCYIPGCGQKGPDTRL